MEQNGSALQPTAVTTVPTPGGAFHHNSNSGINGPQRGITGLRLGKKAPKEQKDSSNVLFVQREEGKHLNWGQRRERSGSDPNWLSLNRLTLV